MHNNNIGLKSNITWLVKNGCIDKEVFLDPNHLQVSKSQERDTCLLTRLSSFSFIADKCRRCFKESVDSGGTDKGLYQGGHDSSMRESFTTLGEGLGR